MNTIDSSTIEELEQAEAALNKPIREVLAQYEEPLTFRYPVEFIERRTSDAAWDEMDWELRRTKNRREGERRQGDSLKRTDAPERREIVKELGAQIATGILWIPPFVSDFWSGRRKKPKPNKCICACCGHKHNLKGA